MRNLVIVPLPGGGGNNGINMTAGLRLTVENCLIANLPATGIYVNDGANVRVTDTTIRDSTYGLWLEGGARATVMRATISGALFTALLVYGTGANTTTADIADSSIDANGTGVSAYSVDASGVVKVSVVDSLIARNGAFGLIAESDAGASVTLSASSNMISNNATAGMYSLGVGSKMWASGNTVSDNTTGLHNNGGLFESAGNNAVRNNGTNKTGTISVIPME